MSFMVASVELGACSADDALGLIEQHMQQLAHIMAVSITKKYCNQLLRCHLTQSGYSMSLSAGGVEAGACSASGVSGAC